jgi:hypothetical protein
VHPSIGTVYDVNIPATIHVDVVSLDGEVANLDRSRLTTNRRLTVVQRTSVSDVVAGM